MHRRPPTTTVRSERGFALLLTVTLLAFLVLTLVALATVTRVETQVAANGQQLAQARQNALMALNIAFGELQKYAGPDQRTTARADLQHGATVPNGRWTGVYGSAVRADYTQRPSEIASALTTQTDPSNGSSARLLTWLVSGNEVAPFDPSTDVGAAGEITKASFSPTFSPTNPLSDLTGADALSDNILIKGKPARLLVGPNSVTAPEDGSSPLDYVAAPLVPIEVPSKSLPGFSDSGGTTPIGRYAWWIGDEGVKARVNLPLADGTLAERRNAFVNASRAAVELMDRTVASDPASPLTAARIDTAYNPAASVDRVVSLSQLPMVSTDNNTAALTTAVKARFHDLTPHSYSVLSDTYAGGLKRDLSALLAGSYSAPSSDETGGAKTLHVSEDGTTYGIPTWRHLRSFAQTTVPTSGPNANTLTPRLPYFNRTDGKIDDVGIAPVLTYVALGFRYAAANTPATGVGINFNLYPLVVLWNPYTSRLKGASYEVGLGHAGWATRVQLQVEDSTQADGWRVKETRDLRYGGMVITSSYGTDKPVQYFRFRVNCPDLEPGQSVVFTLPNITAYTPGVTALEPGLNQTTHASMVSATSFADGEAARPFRMVSSSDMMKVVPGTDTVTGSGANLRNAAGAETYAYLGALRTTAPSTTSTTQWWTPAMNEWYQAMQRVGYDNSSIAKPLQGPSLLGASTGFDEPVLKWFVTAVFSATGSNGTANKNTVPRIRWLAQSNIRAPHAFRTRRDPNYCTSFIAQIGTDDAMWPTWFSTDAPGDRASAGLGHDWDATTNQPTDATLFEFRRDDQPLLSVGQLQHANLSIVGTYPAYPVGNSIADFRLPNFSSLQEATGVPSLTTAATLHKVYYDLSWLLNRTLWDRYFFSSVPDSGNVPTTLPNERHLIHDSAKNLQHPDQAAAGLMLTGGFNINSTSEQAWRAVLGGLNKLAYDPVAGTEGSALGAVLSRFTRPTDGTSLPMGTTATNGTNLPDLWQGYRSLDDKQIAQLARNIVTEIRARGPFVSLADFVNRRLVDNAATTAVDERLKGTLQAAIDATPRTTASAFAANDTSTGNYFGVAYGITTSLPPGTTTYYSLEAARGEKTLVTDAAYRRRVAFAPKFLTQADVLSSIGSSLTARSDTFVIRTYGEALNPLTGDPTGRAWCEAVVQRLPEYVEPQNGTSGNAPEDATALLSARNKTFGRKFKIVSFRWLSPSDI